MSRLKKIEDKITEKLNEMLKATEYFEQYVVKRFQPMFQVVQQKRWQTENASEGSQWEPLNQWYALWKKEAYFDQFGHGEKMMIATGKLYKALTLDDDSRDWSRIINKTTVVYNFDIEYAKSAGEIRPILEFSKRTIERFKSDFKEHLRKVWRLKT
ncbi:MAG TPA: hypothetical protein DGG95_00635 [Cytophagales bacterium]|jgi:hypothetical protein|nr:hypothetical protein [Cytophagales bacterium]